MTASDDRWNPAAETHDQWRRRRILEGQRARRGAMRRIDYYASDAAAALIDGLRRAGVGGDASSILNRVVLEWDAVAKAKRKRVASGIK